MTNADFYQRIGHSQGPPIDNDFPNRARTALAYVILDLRQKCVIDEDDILRELNRIGRITKGDLDEAGIINPENWTTN